MIGNLMIAAALNGRGQPLWFVIALSLGMLAFCIWGFIALAMLKRGK